MHESLIISNPNAPEILHDGEALIRQKTKSTGLPIKTHCRQQTNKPCHIQLSDTYSFCWWQRKTGPVLSIVGLRHHNNPEILTGLEKSFPDYSSLIFFSSPTWCMITFLIRSQLLPCLYHNIARKTPHKDYWCHAFFLSWSTLFLVQTCFNQMWNNGIPRFYMYMYIFINHQWLLSSGIDANKHNKALNMCIFLLGSLY